MRSVSAYIVSTLATCVALMGAAPAPVEASTIAWPQQIAPGGDFFNGLGTAPSADTDRQFRLTWALAGSSEGSGLWDLTRQQASFSRATSNSASWFIDPSSYFRAGYSVMFTMGVNDTAAPKWSTFLLDPANVSGQGPISAASHVRFDPNRYVPTVVSTPEPAALILFGSGLLVLAHRHRRARRLRERS